MILVVLFRMTSMILKLCFHTMTDCPGLVSALEQETLNMFMEVVFKSDH